MKLALDRAPRTFGRWFGGLVFWVAVLYLLFWRLEGSELALHALQRAASVVVPWILEDSIARITPAVDGSWQILTALQIEGKPGIFAVLSVNADVLLRAIMPIPLTLALVLSMGLRHPGRIALALLIASGIALLTVTTYLAGTVSVVVNHAPAIFDDDLLPKPPEFRVEALPYPVIATHLLHFAAYFLVIVAPVIVPILIWAVACRGDVMALFSLGRNTHPQRKSD